MKKLFAIMLTLALLLASAAFAEEAEEDSLMPEDAAVFSGVWVCGRASIEMTWEEEGFRTFISWGSSAWEHTEWEYSCLYNEESKALVSMPTGIRTDITVGDDGEIVSANVIYEDGDATFTLDEEGCLIWQDEKENAGDGMRFEKLPSPFEGTWVCGRASIQVDQEEEGFRVFISWSGSAAEHTEWEYSCLYNEETSALVSMPFGIRTDVVYGEDGEIASADVIYEDGEASFTLDAEGFLIWQDEKEDAGKDMRFERVEILETENAI